MTWQMGLTKKIQKVFLIDVFSENDILQKCQSDSFQKSQTYGPDKALQMRVGAEKKSWKGRELSTLPLIGRRRKSEASLWEIRQLSPYATQLMAIFNTLITEKSKREIQGDLGNWDSIAAHRLYRWLKDPDKCENHSIILHFFCLQKTELMCISSIETGGIRWGFFLFEVFPLRILQTCSLTVPFGGKYSDKKRLGDGSGKWY